MGGGCALCPVASFRKIRSYTLTATWSVAYEADFHVSNTVSVALLSERRTFVVSSLSPPTYSTTDYVRGRREAELSTLPTGGWLTWGAQSLHLTLTFFSHAPHAFHALRFPDSARCLLSSYVVPFTCYIPLKSGMGMHLHIHAGLRPYVLFV